jgi:HSP20 family protein
MALIRWEPFREMESLQRDMNRLFDRMMVPGDGSTDITAGPSLYPLRKCKKLLNRLNSRSKFQA